MSPSRSMLLALALLSPVPVCRGAGDNAAAPPSIADDQLAEYEKVQSVSCSIRKTTRGPNGQVTLLSRVFFERPDRIHVENLQPTRRRIVCDGKRLYYYEAGRPRGYAEAVTNLPPDWLATLRNVPGSPLEHIEKLRNAPETPLPPTGEFPRRGLYHVGDRYVALANDASNRLCRITFFRDAAMTEQIAEYRYERFLQASNAVSIPLLHTATMRLPNGGEITETRILDAMTVNTPVPRELFSPAAFFPRVEFTHRFEETLD